MKYAIIADIHANLEAFQVVLEDTKAQKCTHYACLGDVVGYNANPKECLDIVRSMSRNAGVTSSTSSRPQPVSPIKIPPSVSLATRTCPSRSCAIPSCAAAP